MALASLALAIALAPVAANGQGHGGGHSGGSTAAEGGSNIALLGVGSGVIALGGVMWFILADARRSAPGAPRETRKRRSEGPKRSRTGSRAVQRARGSRPDRKKARRRARRERRRQRRRR